MLNGAKLPCGLVAVARIGRLPGNRGYDVFVTVIRKRGLRATAVARRQSDGGLGFGIAVIFGTALGLEFDIDNEFTVLLPGEPSQYERNLRV